MKPKTKKRYTNYIAQYNINIYIYYNYRIAIGTLRTMACNMFQHV